MEPIFSFSMGGNWHAIRRENNTPEAVDRELTSMLVVCVVHENKNDFAVKTRRAFGTEGFLVACIPTRRR